MDVMDEQDFAGFEFKMSFGRVSYIAQHPWKSIYRQVSDIRLTLVGNTIVDHSDVVGASPVGAAPTTSSLST